MIRLAHHKGAITINKGRVEQGNFDDYKMLRMTEMPAMAVSPGLVRKKRSRNPGHRPHSSQPRASAGHLKFLLS